MKYGVIALAGTLGLAVPRGNAGAQPTQCGPANDTSAALVADLRGWMKTENPNRVVLRDRIFHIPVVSESQVSLVADERICRKVLEAYSNLPESAYTPRRVYVIRIGDAGYAGYDPDREGGELMTVHVFDSEYGHIGGWSFQDVPSRISCLVCTSISQYNNSKENENADSSIEREMGGRSQDRKGHFQG